MKQTAPALMARARMPWIGRDENNRHAMAAGNQPILQLDTGQSRHLQVRDQARRVVHPLGSEKFVG
jgi:hypothetical protein